VKQNVLPDPAIKDLNNKVRQRLQRHYPKRKERIEEWLEDVWVKWCQARLKHVRREVKLRSRSAGEHQTSPRLSQIDIQSSPLPRTRSPKFIEATVRPSALAKSQPPTELAIKSIQLLIESRQIPSVPGLIHWLLENCDTDVQQEDIDSNAIDENDAEEHYTVEEKELEENDVVLPEDNVISMHPVF